jgi:anti-sigma regulatory factor (Ser/Thr protein kinase)
MTVERTEVARYRRYRPAVAVARATARRLSNEWGLTEVTHIVESVVSELVANAVVHGHAARGSRVSVAYHLDAERLRVEVRDWATGMPRTVRRSPAGEAPDESGRGLRVVAALTDRWGVIPRVIGKSVWFEIRLVPGPGGKP